MKDRLLDRIIKFDKLLGITAIVIALVAVFFSVYGIATLFAGAFILTAIMALSLEIGKLVAVTFLYRYWDKTNKLLKTYLCMASAILMIITSIGIFGYLSAAYQKSSIEFKATQEKIVMVEGQKTYLNDKISQSRIRMQTLNDMRRVQESQLSEILTKDPNPNRNLILFDQITEMIRSDDDNIKIEQDKIQSTTDEIQKIDQKVNEMKFASANTKDIRTFQFVAEQFGTTLDTVAKWFIITLIVVFDPLAIALILAYNVVSYKKESPIIPDTNVTEHAPIPLATSEDSPKDIIPPIESPAPPGENVPPPPHRNPPRNHWQ